MLLIPSLFALHMHKKDKRVDDYINNAPKFAKPILKKLRKLIIASSPNVNESIKWNNPFYGLKALGLGFNSAHKEVRLTFFDGSKIKDPKHILRESLSGKKNLFFKNTKDIDEKTVTSYIKTAIEKKGKVKE